MNTAARPWLMRAALFIRATAGITLILGMSAFAGAALVGGLIGVCAQIIVGGMGIAYAAYMRNVSEELSSLNVNRAFVPAVATMLGLPAALVHFFPLHMPMLKAITVVMIIGIGIATVISLMKMKAEEAKVNALVKEHICTTPNSRSC